MINYLWPICILVQAKIRRERNEEGISGISHFSHLRSPLAPPLTADYIGVILLKEHKNPRM